MRQFCFPPSPQPPLLAMQPHSHRRLSFLFPISLDLSGWRATSTSLTRAECCSPPGDLQWQVCAQFLPSGDRYALARPQHRDTVDERPSIMNICIDSWSQASCTINSRPSRKITQRLFLHFQLLHSSEARQRSWKTYEHVAQLSMSATPQPTSRSSRT